LSQQPASTSGGAPINVTVTLQDAFGNTATTATNAVSIAIGSNPGGGTLSGTTTVNAANGVAVFSGLSINKAGMGYTLTASSPGLVGTTSDPFNVAAALPPHIVKNFNDATINFSGSRLHHRVGDAPRA
jgi:hypothetical protein